MGVHVPGERFATEETAEALFSAFTNIAAAEKRKHATVFNYWLSIRGDLHFPLIQDLDPLEISDAGPSSVLLELIGGGEDAEIRHIGQSLKSDVEFDRISAAPSQTILSCIAPKLPLVANSRKVLAFEEELSTGESSTRCWITLFPFSSTGTWIDYVYCFASWEMVPIQVEVAQEVEPEEIAPVDEPGFSPELIESVPVNGFFGTVAKAEPRLNPAPSGGEAAKDKGASEATLPGLLAEVRGKADEARMARLRSEAALHAGLSAAYDFALDAESRPEDYLKIVEEQGLRIQLRSPMAPVAKLAFGGLCDEVTMDQIEAVLAWALKADLPRGTLAERLEAEGGIEALLTGQQQ